MNSNRIIKAVFSVTSVLIIVKLFGFIKQVFVASTFGATIETDLINLSQEFVANIEYVLANTIATAFVSVYILAKTNSKEDGDRLFSDALKLVVAAIGIIVIAIFMVSPAIAKIIAPTYDAKLSSELTFYLRLYAPALLLYIVTSLLGGVLNSNEKFVGPQLSGFFQSVIIIGAVYFLIDKFGINSLVIGFWGYVIWNCIFLLVLSRKYTCIKWGNPLDNKYVITLLKMMGPLLIGYSMIFINQQVDKIIVSGMVAGTVTALTYAAVLTNLVTTLTSAAGTILFTHITTKASAGQHKQAANTAMMSSIIMITVLLPISIITIMCSKDIVTIAFGHGAFDDAAIRSTALALMGYAFSFIPFSLKDLFNRFQYGLQNTKDPMINTTVGILFNIILSIVLSRFIGVLGVALASSISETVVALLNMRKARILNAFIEYKIYYRFIVRWIIGSIFTVAICWSGSVFLAGISVIVKFFMITIIACGIFYLTNINVLKQAVIVK